MAGKISHANAGGSQSGWWRHWATGIAAALALALACSGCSFQATIDRLVDPARQAQIIADARQMCTDITTLRPKFDAATWAGSARAFASVPGECPTGAAAYAFTGYRFNSYTEAGGAINRQEFATVVASTPNRWTEIAISYAAADGGVPKIIGWTVRAASQPPEALTARQTWDHALIWLRAGGIAVIIIAAGGVIWLVRRVRRRGARSLFDA